jgi:hypothetical protein
MCYNEFICRSIAICDHRQTGGYNVEDRGHEWIVHPLEVESEIRKCPRIHQPLEMSRGTVQYLGHFRANVVLHLPPNGRQPHHMQKSSRQPLISESSAEAADWANFLIGQNSAVLLIARRPHRFQKFINLARLLHNLDFSFLSSPALFAFWLRSSVVSVLFSLISGRSLLGPIVIILIFGSGEV